MRWVIKFIGNFETGMQPMKFGESATATLHNTSGSIPQMFLTETASNRAFVRCVRNFLTVNIVGKDEMGPGKDGVKTNEEGPGAAPSAETPPPQSSPRGFERSRRNEVAHAPDSGAGDRV